MKHSGIRTPPVAAATLFARYQAPGNYTDCLCLEVDGEVDLASFILAVLTSRPFRLERFILATLLGKRSNDDQAAALASGSGNRFAAWTVEARTVNQLLLRDFLGHTRTWLMAEPVTQDGAVTRTRLHFGTAVVHIGLAGFSRTGAIALFWMFLPFHKAYARILLGSAVKNLSTPGGPASAR
ncbi:MAG: hypothetical protein ABIW31_02840 [Novosphingobium sp.]